jgi:hypothetical protein
MKTNLKAETFTVDDLGINFGDPEPAKKRDVACCVLCCQLRSKHSTKIMNGHPPHQVEKDFDFQFAHHLTSARMLD